MKILLTGANGNLGTSLRKTGSEFSWIPLNREHWPELNRSFSSGVDAVVHAASDLTSNPAIAPLSVLESNLMTTGHLLEACREHKVKRFIFISSCAVYGRMQETSEDRGVAPLSFNGMVKAVNEKLVGDFCKQNRMKAEIYRVFNMFGGQDRFSILSHIKRSLAEQKPFLLNNGGVSQRDFIHVDDVSQILCQLIRKSPDSSCVNIGSGRTTRIGDIVAIVKKRRPELKIENANREEAEYSRADIGRLNRNIGEFKFRDVLKFVDNGWLADAL